MFYAMKNAAFLTVLYFPLLVPFNLFSKCFADEYPEDCMHMTKFAFQITL